MNDQPFPTPHAASIVLAAAFFEVVDELEALEWEARKAQRAAHPDRLLSVRVEYVQAAQKLLGKLDGFLVFLRDEERAELYCAGNKVAFVTDDMIAAIDDHERRIGLEARQIVSGLTLTQEPLPPAAALAAARERGRIAALAREALAHLSPDDMPPPLPPAVAAGFAARWRRGWGAA